jgi:CRP-like cAMP-binding protein
MKRLGSMLRPREQAAGAAVIVAGDREATEMYFIHDGTAEVLAADGRTLATLGPGEFFGEDALLTDAPRNANVHATTPLLLYVLAKTDLHAAFEEFPGLEALMVRQYEDLDEAEKAQRLEAGRLEEAAAARADTISARCGSAAKWVRTPVRRDGPGGSRRLVSPRALVPSHRATTPPRRARESSAGEESVETEGMLSAATVTLSEHMAEHEWTQRYSEEQQRPFWVNEKTGRKTWERTVLEREERRHHEHDDESLHHEVSISSN